MIKDIFIPEKIGSYYVIPKRIIGLDIGKTHVSATSIYMSGSKAIIEQCTQHILRPGTSLNYVERVQETLKILAEQLPKYDEIKSALSNSAVIFKKIKLPFINYNNIKLIIYYEIEPLLPFSIEEAIIDFIIIDTIKEEQSAEVLVAAVQKKQIADHLEFFENTSIQPDVISVDAFSLYSLYMQISKENAAKSVALIDLGAQDTTICYIYKEGLRFIRTLPKGVIDIAKKVSIVRKKTPQEILEYIIRFGLEDNDNTAEQEALRDVVKSFWQEIGFTLHSFVAQTDAKTPVEKIIIFGGGAQMKGLTPYVSHITNISCEHINLEQFFNTNTLLSKKINELAQHCVMSTAIALPSPIIDQFNLRQKEFSPPKTNVIYKQLITAILLLVCLLSGLFLHSFLQIRTLRRELHHSEEETIVALKKQFPQIPKEETTLEDVVDSAQRKLIEEEKVWFAFSSGARSSVLAYLLELFTRLDKQALGLKVEQISIQGNVLTLKAEVKDHQALKILEKDLRESSLFEHVEGQENPAFTMKIKLAHTTERH